MKRLTLLLAILFISVLSSACVNNFAIQELNNKAQEYLQKGDADSAICRLEASLDLDSEVFETRYNLGIAYLNAKKYDKAIESLKKATELKPDFADTYYSLAVATDELNSEEIEKIKNPVVEEVEETLETPVVSIENTAVEVDKKVMLTVEDKEKITKLTNEIIDAYKAYLDKNPEADEKDSINNRIATLENNMNFDTAPQQAD